MDADAPQVSVIIATYNWSSVLRYALASVQAQTLTNFELIVVGDHCTDDSAAVVASFRDPRFHWENLPSNHGHQSAPNNRGLERGRGKWIAYLGHDDLWMPNHLELLLRAVERDEGDVAFSLAMVIGAPDCGGRRLFGAFESGRYPRGAHLPPSALVHRKSLIAQVGDWPDYRRVPGSPETNLLERFYDYGARFVALSEVTVFKFPSSWRPLSYREKRCNEQAEFFRRMHQQPDFLKRELIDFALSQELLRPHTKMLAVSPEDEIAPGALIATYRRARGLTDDAAMEGPARFVASPALSQTISAMATDAIRQQQNRRFATFELFFASDGVYGGPRHTRTLIPLGKWTRLRISLTHTSEGAPLRIDPCDQPAVVEIAYLALRDGRDIKWRARGKALSALPVGGDAVTLSSERTWKIQSRGNDPQFFLPPDVNVRPPLVLDCWLRITRDEPLPAALT